MKLFIYEHCPFCARTRYIGRKLGIEFDEIILDYIDEKTPTELIGKKVVPILQKDDGSVMADSMDIIEYFFSLKNQERMPLSDDIVNWQRSLFPWLQRIGYPRWTHLNLGEFATKASVDAWIEKKQTEQLNFEHLIADTESIANDVSSLLQTTEILLTLQERRSQRSLVDQAICFSLLRGFCCEEAIQWPPTLYDWLINESHFTKVSLLR